MAASYGYCPRNQAEWEKAYMTHLKCMRLNYARPGTEAWSERQKILAERSKQDTA